jgi:hypothetical protein
VKNRFQNLPFKFNLQRYKTVSCVQIIDMAGVDRNNNGGNGGVDGSKPGGGRGAGAAAGKRAGAGRGGRGGGGAAEDAALKALSRVVENLADARSHVPYRDSKLTRLVAPVLGGRGRLLALVGVSPTAVGL